MLYTAIFKSSTIIVDYSDEMGDFAQMVKKMYNTNRQPVEFYEIPYLNYDYYFLHNDPYTFTTITQANLDNEKILLFLQELKQQYQSLINSNETNNGEIKSVTLVRNLMRDYTKKLENNKIKKVENKLQSIINEKKTQLEESGEKDLMINRMMEKASNLKDGSIQLKVNALHKFQSHKNRKYCIYGVIGSVGFGIIFYIFVGYNRKNESKP